MKFVKILLFFIFITPPSTQPLFGQGIEFFDGTFEEALAKATKEEKMIFMDAFAEWCGPCKRMAATAFKDAKVGAFFNQNFICLKRDMEKGEGAQLAQRYPISAYPTLFFFNGKGERVHMMVGGLDAPTLLNLGKTALTKTDNLKEMDAKYEKGERNAIFLANYVRALNRSNRPTLKVVNDFIGSQKDFVQTDALKVVFEGTTEADSRVFDYLLKHRPAIEKVYSTEQVKTKIDAACWKTVMKAIDFKSEELLKEAKKKYKLGLPADAEHFNAESEMKYYEAMLDAKNYVKACETFAKKYVKKDASKLNKLAEQMFASFPKDKNVLQSAEKYAELAASTGGLPNYQFIYANILFRLGKKEKASKVANQALENAKTNAPQYVPALEQLLEQIRNS